VVAFANSQRLFSLACRILIVYYQYLMKAASRRRLSRIRQALSRLLEEHRRLVESLLGERGPLIRGSFVRQKRRCGRPTCRCSRGELHDAALLTSSEQGRMRSVHVPHQDRERVDKQAGRYRRLRRSRARLGKLHREFLDQIDALQQILTQPYPPLPKEKRKREEP